MKLGAFLIASSLGAMACMTPAMGASAGTKPTVTACSKNGHFTCYTAVVGEGRYGPKLRLKHGTWIDCEGDCRDTLRRTTVDYWDDRRENY